ncbi:N-acetyltransferase [Spiribacter halobius]|uniref:N-acetyltransferase n=2 Tax=Sediminicurvatus halobius TaxID=2182432 RepID=A0A2U2N8K4_9GAMM|nr:N-acetyltransferase [Spiribacter halobius]
MNAAPSRNGPAPPAIIRRLWWSERGMIADHLLRLSPHDRYQRFGGHVSDATVTAHALRGDAFRRHFLGAFVDGALRGVAECALLDGLPPREAELAFSVERSSQGRGIGTELFRRMLVFARNRGVARVFILTLAGNRRMRHIAAKFHLAMEAQEGELEGRLQLVAPDYLSVLSEAMGEGGAWVQASVGSVRRVWPPSAHGERRD